MPAETQWRWIRRRARRIQRFFDCGRLAAIMAAQDDWLALKGARHAR